MHTPPPVSFDYTYADYRALNRLMRRESLWKRTQLFRLPVMAAVGILALVAALAAFGGRSAAGSVSAAVTMWQFWAVVAVFAPLAWVLNQIEMKVYFRRQRIDGSRIVVRFDDEKGIVSEGPLGSGVLPWSAVRKVVNDGEALAVLYENRMIGLCLPRRAFASPQAFDDAARYMAARMAR